MRKIFAGIFLSLSASCWAQDTTWAEEPTAFIYKVNGEVGYLKNDVFEPVLEKTSLQNGMLIKPEGIIILKSGKELVLKDGEYFNDLFGIRKATDSTLYDLKIRQLATKIRNLEEDNGRISKSMELLIKKIEVLNKKADLVNKKADLTLSSNPYIQSKAEIRDINNSITEVEKELKELDKTFSRLD